MYLVRIVLTYRINAYVYIYKHELYIPLRYHLAQSFVLSGYIAIASIVKVLAAIVLGSILFVVVRARTNYVHKKGLVVITAKGFHFVSYVNKHMFPM